MRIMIIGLGYVGLVTGACFAKWGHQIIGVDISAEKLEKIKNKEIPFYEPGLEELLSNHHSKWSFHQSIAEGLKQDPDAVFICVGTPLHKRKGTHYLHYVFESAREIAQNVTKEIVVISKSTVSVGCGDEIRKALSTFNPNIKFHVGSNPETLAEGNAIKDFMEPDRLIFGCEDEVVKKTFEEIYFPLVNSAPCVFTDVKSAEMIKIASNVFLATRISFANLMSQICEKNGADIEEVMRGVGMDKRIGSRFLKAGIGFGGSCFRKDAMGLFRSAKDNGGKFLGFLENVLKINQNQRKIFVNKVMGAFWHDIRNKKAAVWGLSFKPDTDDVREAPSLDIIQALLKDGMPITAYDPKAIETFNRKLIESISPEQSSFLTYTNDKYEALKDAHVLLILTDWPEFKEHEIDFDKIKELMAVPRIIDGRNMMDPVRMKKRGFQYICFGRNS